MLILLHLGLCSLSLGLKFSLKSLKGPAFCDAKGFASLRSKVGSLCRIKIKERTLLEHYSKSLCLCKFVHGVLRLLIDRSLKVLLKLLKFLLEDVTATGTEVMVLITGCVVSFLVSLFVIKSLMEYVRKNSFSIFGIYRIILGAVVLLYFFIKGT